MNILFIQVYYAKLYRIALFYIAKESVPSQTLPKLKSY